MSYNGIGLATVRGSSTNGYVQSSKFHVRPKHMRARKEQHRETYEAPKLRRADPSIVEHQQKRQIEIKLLELSDAMEEHGYSEEVRSFGRVAAEFSTRACSLLLLTTCAVCPYHLPSMLPGDIRKGGPGS